MSFFDKPEKARIVIALAISHNGYVIATDSEWVAMEVDGVSDMADDIGILKQKDYKNDPGLYLWEGTLQAVISGPPDAQEPETKYEGTLRKIESEEMKELLAMHPPVPLGLNEDENDESVE